jgi:hypothetical protein
MSMRVRVSDPALLPELVSHLLQNDCVAQPVDEETCRVVHVHAHDGSEAFAELLFFLRAWQARQRGSVHALLLV